MFMFVGLMQYALQGCLEPLFTYYASMVLHDGGISDFYVDDCLDYVLYCSSCVEKAVPVSLGMSYDG